MKENLIISAVVIVGVALVTLQWFHTSARIEERKALLVRVAALEAEDHALRQEIQRISLDLDMVRFRIYPYGQPK